MVHGRSVSRYAAPLRLRPRSPPEASPARRAAAAPSHLEETDTQSATRARRFVVATLASFLGLLGGVLALNVVVDPFALSGAGVAPPAVEVDRSIKLTLLDELGTSPDILILGSSRSRQAEPAYVQQLTGHDGFNAGVTGGSAADAWVFTRYAADRFAHERREYLWFVDVGIADRGVNPQLAADPRAAKFLSSPRRFGLKDVSTYLSFDATRASFRVLRRCLAGDCDSPSATPARPLSHGARISYRPDGSIPGYQLRYLPEHERNVKEDAARLVASVRAQGGNPIVRDRRRYEFFERTLSFMNSRGERPVIVLNPIYPTVLAAFERTGFPGLRASMSYLRELRGRGFRFVVVNCEDIRTWGGRIENFSNPTHVDRRNMRRMLRYIVAHSEGALS